MPSRNMETYLKLKEAADMADDLTSEKAQQAMWDAYAPGFTIYEPASLPYGGVHEGRENWLKMSNEMRSYFEQKVSIDQIWDLPESDLIILYTTMEWKARSTGKVATFPAIELLYFTDAKISKIEMFLSDTKLIMDTLT